MLSNELAEIAGPKSRIRSSQARLAFANNSMDMTAYYSVHQHFVKAVANAVKKQVYILDKATYVLVASLWEAYCQDVLTESLTLLVDHAPSWNSLPRRLTRDISKELRKDDSVTLAPWMLAGDGWRQYVKDRQLRLSYERNYDFSGPKSASVERFFSEGLGLTGIRDYWRTKVAPEICHKLDEHLDARNVIVHQITPGRIVFKRHVKDFYSVVRRLIKCTDQAIDELLIAATGQSHWQSYVRIGPVDIADKAEQEAD
jgi:RiboL-PSP-HEPN